MLMDFSVFKIVIALHVSSLQLLCLLQCLISFLCNCDTAGRIKVGLSWIIFRICVLPLYQV